MDLPQGGLHEDLCFHAQQAAEKSLKAIYQHRGWTFRYVHDLEELLTGLAEHGVKIPDGIERCLELTSYASEARYPGLYEAVTPVEHARAVEIAEQVLSWAESLVV
jgi:HEPN domain-containing protein